MSFRRVCAMVVFVLLAVARPARADGFLIPFAGVNFGGSSKQNLGQAFDASRFDWGVSLAGMGGGVFGGELDFGYSPDFFGKTDLGGSSVFTGFGNLLIGVPVGGERGAGLRPYVLAGVGTVHPKGAAFNNAGSFNEWKVGWDAGGGVMIFFADHVGVRADVRYLRTFETLTLATRSANLAFARFSGGLILRWD